MVIDNRNHETMVAREEFLMGRVAALEAKIKELEEEKFERLSDIVQASGRYMRGVMGSFDMYGRYVNDMYSRETEATFRNFDAMFTPIDASAIEARLLAAESQVIDSKDTKK